MPAPRTLVSLAPVASVGAGMAVLVGASGTVGWQIVRVSAALLITAGVLQATTEDGWRRTLTLLALGVLAVPAGAGIAGPHLVKTGFTGLALAGMTVLVGGLALIVVGARSLFCRLRARTAVPAVAATGLVLGVLLWTLGQATAATNVPRTAVGGTTPADLGLAYEDVVFDARDGVRLSGWYVPSRNGAAVVLLHGAGSTRSGVLRHAVVLAKHDFGVLLYDARGHGRSDGRAMDFGWYGDPDIEGAIAFLQRQEGVDADRLALVGMSMGGEEAIGAAAGVDGIAAVVAEGVTNRVARDKAWLSEEYGLRGFLTEQIGKLTYGFTDLLTDASPPIALRDAVEFSATPLLLIAGGDVPDEISTGRFLRAAAPGRVELWVVPGAGHTDGLQLAPDDWEHRVIGFLEASLPGPS